MTSIRFAGKTLRELAEWLIDRPLTADDGYTEDIVAEAEVRLGLPLPAPLREFCRIAGKHPELAAAFNRFDEPSQLARSKNKIVFLEENQTVCIWATDQKSNVYQCTNIEQPRWYKEPVLLETFLRTILYYQMAQGGYPFAGMIPGDSFESEADLKALIARMDAQPVVNESGLQIFVLADQVLVWFLESLDGSEIPDLFLSALRRDQFLALCDQWEFDDLG